MNKIGFAVTGSFCSMDDMLDVLKQLCQNYEVEVFVTPHVYKMDTRFYSHSELISHIQNITGKKSAYDNSRSRNLWSSSST